MQQVSAMAVFFLISFLILQFFLFILFFFEPIFTRFNRRAVQRTIMFLSIQLLCTLLILGGGYLEYENKLYSVFRKPMDEYLASSSESPIIEGDPGLVQWIESQRPIIPRPDFSNAQNFLFWQNTLRSKLRDIFKMPDMNSPIEVYYHKMSSTTLDQGIKRVFLTFRSFDGTTIPAYLFMPLSVVIPQPAIIVLPGHVGIYQEGITDTAGLVDSYQHGAALELAKAGFITLTIELRGFGYLGRKINTEHKLIAHNAILGGSFYKAVIAKDIKYAFDLLQSLPEVNSGRIGITGASYGGEMAVTYSALDERIKVVVFNAFGGLVGAEKAVYGKDSEQPHYCHTIPGNNEILLQEDMYYLIAPRPLMGIRGDRDFFENPVVFTETVSKAYNILNALSSFRFQILHGDHEYFVQPSVQFFKEHL